MTMAWEGTNMHMRLLFALMYTYLLVSSTAAQEMSFARVAHCKNDAGRAELYLPGSVVLGRGPEQVRLGDRTVSGYLAFDFTPVGKNKTLNAVGVSMSEKKDSLIVEFSEGRSAPTTIPVRGGTTRFPQRLAEEMICEPLNVD
jgi:hypothetical protein